MLSERETVQEMLQKLKEECLEHIEDEKEQELFLKRLIFVLVRT